MGTREPCPTLARMAQEPQEYIQQKVNPILENLVTQLLLERPEQLAPFMIKWLSQNSKTPAAAALTEGVNVLSELKLEMEKLQEEVRELEAQVEAQRGDRGQAVDAAGSSQGQSEEAKEKEPEEPEEPEVEAGKEPREEPAAGAEADAEDPEPEATKPKEASSVHDLVLNCHFTCWLPDSHEPQGRCSNAVGCLASGIWLQLPVASACSRCVVVYVFVFDRSLERVSWEMDLEGNDIPAEAGPTQQATPSFEAEASTRPRAALQAQDAPDAGRAFQALSTSMASPKFSFGSRAKGSQSRPKAPGPGSYMDPSADLNSRHKRLPRFGFGTDSRLVKLVNRTPGPGSYSVTMVLGSDATKISCTPRREVKQTKPRQKARNLGELPVHEARRPSESILQYLVLILLAGCWHTKGWNRLYYRIHHKT
ncbi:nsa2 [Symbiodinium sp. CCMP2592]|nr:nsa2 [Symbiodinium sp. CCMP2592]